MRIPDVLFHIGTIACRIFCILGYIDGAGLGYEWTATLLQLLGVGGGNVGGFDIFDGIDVAVAVDGVEFRFDFCGLVAGVPVITIFRVKVGMGLVHILGSPNDFGAVIVLFLQQSRQRTVVLDHFILALFLGVVDMAVHVDTTAVITQWVHSHCTYFISDIIEVLVGAAETAVLAGVGGRVILQPVVVEHADLLGLLVRVGLADGLHKLVGHLDGAVSAPGCVAFTHVRMRAHVICVFAHTPWTDVL